MAPYSTTIFIYLPSSTLGQTQGSTQHGPKTPLRPTTVLYLAKINYFWSSICPKFHASLLFTACPFLLPRVVFLYQLQWSESSLSRKAHLHVLIRSNNYKVVVMSPNGTVNRTRALEPGKLEPKPRICYLSHTTPWTSYNMLLIPKMGIS